MSQCCKAAAASGAVPKQRTQSSLSDQSSMSDRMQSLLQIPGCPLKHACAAQLEGEARLRLVAGLKKYFHSKQREGLLSAEGTQLLDWACSMAMDDAARPLGLWQNIHRCRLPVAVTVSWLCSVDSIAGTCSLPAGPAATCALHQEELQLSGHTMA